MYDLVDRYLRRLDSELFKFKCELEADHNGITEILEKRSLELDGTSSVASGSSQKENRCFRGFIVGSGNNHASVPNRDRYRTIKLEKRRDSSSGGGSSEKRHIANNNALVTQSIISSIRPTTPTLVITSAPPTTTVSYSLQHIGAGNAIAAAASQAIAATQQMQQGRRTASLKASYEAIHGPAGTHAHELLLGRELTTGGHVNSNSHNTIQVVDRDANAFNNQRRHKK